MSFLLPQAFAQDTQPSEPLSGQREIVPGNELALIWTDSDRNTVSQKLYDYVSFGNPAIQDSLQSQAREDLSDQFPIAGQRGLEAVSGDFDDNGTDEIIVVWESTDQSVVAHHPSVGLDTSGDLPALDWGINTTYELKPTGTLNTYDRTGPHLQIATGQFDEDGAQDLVLAYIDANDALHLEIFNITNGQLQSEFDAALIDLPLNATSTVAQSIRFDVNTGDLNDDGIDEILIAASRQIFNPCSANTTECWAATAYVYEVTGGSFSPAGEVDLFTKSDGSREWLSAIAIEAGDFDGNGSNELAASIEWTNNSSQSFWRLYGFTWDGSGFEVKVDKAIHQTTGNTGFPLAIQAEDMDFDGKDELVIAHRNLTVHAADTLFSQFSTIAGGDFFSTEENSGRQMMTVADIDGASRMWYSTDDRSVHRPEIIMTKSFEFSEDGGISVDRSSSIEVYRFTPSQFNLDLLSQKSRDQTSDNDRAWPMAIVSGNFGDRGIRVGAPTFYRETEIVQPLVILNAPPIHFDAFGGNIFDVSNCYQGGGCGFLATYTEQSTQTVEVTSEVRGDWQLGAGLEGNLNSILNEIPVAGEVVAELLDVLGLGIDFNLEAKYGEGFSELVGSQQTIKVTTQVSTFEDDAIYATVSDYDIWEYPLYVRGQFAGNMVIIIPKPVRDQWFTSKTPEAASYRPGHEFGNILSYPKDLNPARLSQQVFAGTENILGSQTLQWDVTQEQTQFSASSSSTSLLLNGELDISLPIPTLSLNVNGNYSNSTLTTHSTSVSNLQAVTLNLGQIETTIEGLKSNYRVTPFVYWDRSGALVVDYSVEPSVAAPGEVETWWQNRYGQLPDPAFNLPERYEDLKTGNAVDPGTLSRSKSLSFFPQIVEPGETVSIQALVQNYSLLPTASEVPVRFYAGNPADGGTPITGITGNPDPVLPVMEARGSAKVNTTWTLPSGFNESAIRIYAVIDPDNSLSEIHESNNTGWAPLRTDGNIGTSTEEDVLPDAFTLHANYPNPFNPFTTLSFSIDRAQLVRLSVFDVLGREVRVLIDGHTPAGLHEVRFDAQSLSSGTYFYRLQTNNRAEVRSMVLMK